MKIKGMLPTNNLYSQQKYGGTYIALCTLVFKKSAVVVKNLKEEKYTMPLSVVDLYRDIFQIPSL